LVNNKVVVILILGFMLVGFVSAFVVNYSSPTHQDGSEITYKEHPTPIKTKCVKEEWNNNFQKFREGLISKEDMKSYIGGCEW